MTLLELAERCEQGHVDYQRTLLSDAAYAVFGDEADHRDDPTFWPKAVDFVAKLRAQAYLDAALALVPEGWSVTLFIALKHPTTRCTLAGNGETVESAEQSSIAKVPALAVCAAALKARAASCDTRPEGGDGTKIAAPFTGGAVPHEDAADAQPSGPILPNKERPS